MKEIVRFPASCVTEQGVGLPRFLAGWAAQLCAHPTTNPPPIMDTYAYTNAVANVRDPTCSAPWSALIVLLAFILVVAIMYLVQVSMTFARRHKRAQNWKQWERHKRRVAGPMRAEGEALVQSLQQQVGGAGTVTMGGSVTTGAVQPTSDIDIKIVANTCQDYADIAAKLQADDAYTHVHSGGKFALFNTTTPGGVPVDVSLEVMDPDKVLSATALLLEQQAAEREARGYLEHIIRRAHPDMTIRRDKTFA